MLQDSIVNYTRERLQKVLIAETCLAVDKQMIPFKGGCDLKPYFPKKQKRWGYKLWVLAGKSGYVCSY